MEKFLYTPKNNKNCYKLWMAYPAIESFGLSSLGYMWLYKIADTLDGIEAERIATDTSTTKFNPNEVNAIAFSMSFDFDFLGVFEILEKKNIPFLKKEKFFGKNNKKLLTF